MELKKNNIVIHSQKEKRFKCKTCGKTFANTKGTIFYKKQYKVDIIKMVISLAATGCPIQSIVFAMELDERTVMRWINEASLHSKIVHKELVLKPQDLKHVQADEMFIKAFKMRLWMAFAIVSDTKLWLGGFVSENRDIVLIKKLVNLIRISALKKPLVIITDGFSAYKNAILSAFKLKLDGKNVWGELMIAQVIKSTKNRKLIDVKTKIIRGSKKGILDLLKATNTGNTINTSYIERINSTFRSRMSFFTRKTRNLLQKVETVENMMYLNGTFYNFCIPHKSLTRKINEKNEKMTPTMRAGITFHIWKPVELLSYKVKMQNPTNETKTPILRAS